MDFTGDETISPFAETYVKFAEGSYDSSNTIISYWNTLFQGIRQCYLLKANISSVPNISKDEIDLYTAEADFLIAYFHLLLIKCYGPTVLVDVYKRQIIHLTDIYLNDFSTIALPCILHIDFKI